MSARQSLRTGVALAALVAVATLARADAPADQYRVFNKNDVLILDRQTLLQWQRDVAVQATFAGAQGYCSALALGGLTSWRVPSYKELQTLVDENPHDEYPSGAPVPTWIDGNAFPQTPASAFWSSSLSTVTAGDGYQVSFGTGAGSAASEGSMAYVRCVHD